MCILLLSFFSGTAAATTSWVPATGSDADAVTVIDGKVRMPSLRNVFDIAWPRQPEAQSLTSRQDAAEADRQVAQSWTVEPVALDMSLKTDQLNRNQGAREYELGLAIPLWLPGERSRSGELADAMSRNVDTRVAAAKLRTAAAVRETYWLWRRAGIEFALSHDRLINARTLAADVARRVKAGDLSRADQYQADGAVAAAESAIAEGDSALAGVSLQLRALAGQTMPDLFGIRQGDKQFDAMTEPVPDIPASFSDLDISHPVVKDLIVQAEVAKRAAALARVQTRGNPELVLAATRDRGMFDDPYQQTFTFGIRIPFGSDPRYRARLAAANADALESESQLLLERERILADLDSAGRRVESSRIQAEAAERRAHLAQETRGFFEKSFRLGETDLPTRLRIEMEAVEAQRQAALSRIEHAAAISALRQSLGLLPE